MFPAPVQTDGLSLRPVRIETSSGQVWTPVWLRWARPVVEVVTQRDDPIATATADEVVQIADNAWSITTGDGDVWTLTRTHGCGCGGR